MQDRSDPYNAPCTCTQKGFGRKPGRIVNKTTDGAFCKDCGQGYRKITQDGVRPKKR